MRWNPRRAERKADRLEDLASALQAGLDVRSILTGSACAGLRGPVSPELGTVAALRERGLALEDLDWSILQAAERAGDLCAALRERAAAARVEAELVRDLLGRLAYPCFLIGAATFLVAWLYASGLARRSGPWVTAILVAVAVLAVAVIWIWRRARSHEEFSGSGVPVLGSLIRDLGEFPYLMALHGLYAAGILLPEAHDEAAGASPVAAMRARLRRATSRLREGEGFAETLAIESALGSETLQLIRNGEVAGELEESLQRAADRRRQVLTLRLRRIARVVGAIVYAVAVVVVAIIVLDFYGSRFA